MPGAFFSCEETSRQSLWDRRAPGGSEAFYSRWQGPRLSWSGARPSWELGRASWPQQQLQGLGRRKGRAPWQQNSYYVEFVHGYFVTVFKLTYIILGITCYLLSRWVPCGYPTWHAFRRGSLKQMGWKQHGRQRVWKWMAAWCEEANS